MTGASLSKCSAFIYGCAATLEAEVFITDNIAAAARLRGRVLWGRCFGSVPLPLRRFIEVCFLTANEYLHEKKSEVFIYLLLCNYSIVIHNVMR